jgi:hypothetical protein
MWFVRPMLAQIVGRLYRSPTCPHPFFLLATWLLLIHITLCFFLLLSPCKVDSWRLPCASHLEEGHASHALSHWYICIFFYVAIWDFRLVICAVAILTLFCLYYDVWHLLFRDVAAVILWRCNYWFLDVASFLSLQYLFHREVFFDGKRLWGRSPECANFH